MNSILSALCQAWNVNVRYREILIIVSLLIATLVFGFVIIPLEIGEGYGEAGPGLSPRIMPELATAGIAVALLFGLARLYSQPKLQLGEDLQSHHEGGHPFRAIVAIIICLFFATVGFRLVGFYVGGVTMAILLTLLLGERKIVGTVVVPILVLAAIYLVFEVGFQIRLPKSNLIPGVPI